MFRSVIHIGPEILNFHPTVQDDISSVSLAIDSAVLTGSVALLVGLGIFFTLGLRFDPDRFFQRRGADEGVTYRVSDENIRRFRNITLIMFTLLGAALIFAIFPELAFNVLSAKASIARVVLAISVVFVIIFIIQVIRNPIHDNNRRGNNVNAMT